VTCENSIGQKPDLRHLGVALPESTPDLLARFEAQRSRLTSLSYRILGSRTEAQDVLQEAWLRWQSAEHCQIQSDRGWLTTVVTHLCLDLAKSARARREHYVGPWLPEPWLGELPLEANCRLEAVESLSLAFLALLERLSPLERAVFVLHEALELEHREVGEILGRDESSCRQLLHRARRHLAGQKPRFASSTEAHQRMTLRFLQLAAQGDVASLAQLFAADVRATSDGGGQVKAALKPILGPDAVARFLIGVASKFTAASRVEIVPVNGSHGLLIRTDGRVAWVISIECDDERIYSILTLGNPAKLTQ
jgi:RNA polymerase sigma-70 factor (ECF subfamily)